MKSPTLAEYIKKAILRIDAPDLARGRRLFSDDISLDEPVVLRVLRSDKTHARIVSLDVEKANQIPGVVHIFSAADVPGINLHGMINKDQPLLAQEKVRFLGEAVALVAAENKEAAEQAIRAIQVHYEKLPVVFDPVEALRDHAPLVHKKGNLLFQRRITKGDVEKGLAESYRVVRQTYTTPHLEHSYLEPDAGAGYVDGDGTLVIYASTQNPHYDQKAVSELLGLDEEKIRIIQAATGGGFGSKLDLTVQGFIGLALYHLKRPVRLVYDREEAYLVTSKRHPLIMQMESGVGRDGRLLALKATIICDTGAYASYGVAVATRSAIHASGPYEIENVEVESLCVYTNNPTAGAMRGFGVPQIAIAHESQMDMLAYELDMDPLEIRRINALRPGSFTGTGQKLEASVGILKALDAIEPYYESAKGHWKQEGTTNKQKRGIGIGAMWYGIGNTGVQNPSTARLEMAPEGYVTIYTGAADIGQGSSTVLTQIASEILGLEPSKMLLVAADTQCTSNAGATSASRQTYISGNAVKEAAEKLADVLLTEAADVLKRPKASLVLKGGFAMDESDEQKRVPLPKLARRAHVRGRPLTWQGYFDPDTTPLDVETGQGNPYATYAYACHLALATVDLGTGEVQISKVVAAHDVGKAIHPQNVEGQIHGGIAMGLGFALMEKFVPGRTSSMAHYHVPTSVDIPEIITIIIEDEEPTGPFGAKGVGEPALIPTAPAILNAVADALGKRIYRLPASPESVYTKIRAT